MNQARLRALQPTHVIVNVDENPRELAERLMADGLQVIVTHPLAPEDNIPLYRLIGGIFNRAAEAETLAAEFEQALAELRQVAWPRRRVLYLIWREPWMGVSRDTYIARMLALVGWETLPAESEARYPALEMDRVAAERRRSDPVQQRAVSVPASTTWRLSPAITPARWKNCG